MVLLKDLLDQVCTVFAQSHRSFPVLAGLRIKPVTFSEINGYLNLDGMTRISLTSCSCFKLQCFSSHIDFMPLLSNPTYILIFLTILEVLYHNNGNT